MVRNKRIQEIDLEIQKLTEEIKGIQDACPHQNFEEGLTVIGCVAPVLLCVECGFAKPLDITNQSDFIIES
jgi:hypothetical protein